MKTKKLYTILFLTVSIFIFSCSKRVSISEQTVNPLLGDISFVSKFGYYPTLTTDEDLRIKTHLEYVENFLRQKDIHRLTSDQKESRNHLLDLLHTYWTAGIFPRNHDFKDKRVPCFIDKDGRICAVGYLVEQTVGRQTAQLINQNEMYEKLLAMNNQTVDSWISNSGLSKEECAMIQPTYGSPPSSNNNWISSKYGIGTSILGGVNISLNTINAIQISKGTDIKTVPAIGLMIGAGSIIYGVVNFPKENSNSNFYSTNESEKILSMVNIGLGTTTMILSICNLALNRPQKNKSFTYNIFSFSSANDKLGFGLMLTKRI